MHMLMSLNPLKRGRISRPDRADLRSPGERLNPLKRGRISR